MREWVGATRSPGWRSCLWRKLNKKALRYLDNWALLADDISREDELGEY
jgi:hypothetical protein